MKEKLKYFDVEDRKFAVKKFNAKTGLKMVKLIIAKILPVFDGFTTSLADIDVNNIQKELQDRDLNIDEFLSLDKVVNALNLLSDEDLDKIIDVSLKHCYELLPAGQTLILNDNGTYGVSDIEDDPILVLRLTAEAIIWSASNFFDVSRLTGTLKPILGSFQLNAQM